MYGKIENGVFNIAPNKLKTENSLIYNPSVSMLIQQGYKEIITSPMPVNQGYYYTPSYIDDGIYIQQSWVEHIQEDDEITQLQLAVAELAELVTGGV